MPLLTSTLGLAVPEYGYVLSVAVAAGLVNTWHGFLVASARKAAGIAYPAPYATNEQAEADVSAKKFNCAQRAHGNYLESLPTFLILLGTAGIRYPVYTAIAGLVWLAGRVVYTVGYATGLPEKRTRGAFAYFGLFGLLGMSCVTCYKMIAGQF